MRDITGIDPNKYTVVQNWSSWDRDTQVSNVHICRPLTIQELVAAMWHYRQKSIRAVGSGWSLSNVHQPEEIALDLKETTKERIGKEAYHYIRLGIRDRGRFFFELKCGAKLYQINEKLWDWDKRRNRGFSFPTLGGSHGQTLGGALATGTHGGDFAYSSVNDAIHAIHLVVPGGKEYWIERNPDKGVTDLSRLPRHALDWYENMEIIQDDEVFAACLISCGRLGVMYSVLVEVESRFYQEQETLIESWKEDGRGESVENALRKVISDGNWEQPLFAGQAPYTKEAESPSFLEIHYDPKGNASFIRRRWRTQSTKPIEPFPESGSPASDAHDLGLAQFFTNIGQVVNFVTNEAFAEVHRQQYAKVLTNGRHTRMTRFRDKSYNINVGRLSPGMTWEVSYREFETHGPFVESMEFFFDAMNTRYIDFINKVHDTDWGALCGGYLALRYTQTHTTSLLGTARFDQTVAVEITILRGFRDADGTRQAIMKRAREAGALAHWGQENPHSAPAINEMFGTDLRKWRKMIPKLLGEYADACSNAFTREKGLEYGPGLKIAYRGRLRCWLGWSADRTATLWKAHPPHQLITGGLRFTRGAEYGLRIQSNGEVVTRILGVLNPPSDAGKLVIKREGKVMASIEANQHNGRFYTRRVDKLPNWMVD